MESELISVMLEGPDANLASLQAVEKWLGREQLGVRLEQRTVTPPAGAMGGTLPTILSVLGKNWDKVLEAIKSLYNYLVARRPKLKLVVMIGNDKVELDAENLPDLAAVTSQATSIITALQKK